MTQDKIGNYVTGEQPFFILKTHFSVGESANGYTLQKSVDCNDANGKTKAGTDATWADYTIDDEAVAVDAGDQLEVSGCGPRCWWRLKGNSGVVVYE